MPQEAIPLSDSYKIWHRQESSSYVLSLAPNFTVIGLENIDLLWGA